MLSSSPQSDTLVAVLAFASQMLKDGRADVYDLILDTILRPLQMGIIDEDRAQLELKRIYGMYTRSNYNMINMVEREDGDTLASYKREQQKSNNVVLDAYEQEMQRLNRI
jgi:hypothetical protein